MDIGSLLCFFLVDGLVLLLLLLLLLRCVYSTVGFCGLSVVAFSAYSFLLSQFSSFLYLHFHLIYGHAQPPGRNTYTPGGGLAALGLGFLVFLILGSTAWFYILWFSFVCSCFMSTCCVCRCN